MAPQTPLVLVDSLFDVNAIYPGALLTTSSELTGREGYRVIDARRERSWWQATGTGTQSIVVDLGSGQARNADYLWLDRGHNLWSTTVGLDFSDNGSSWTTHRALTVPAFGTVGGDPTLTTPSVTEEGAVWALFASAAASHRYWRLVTNTGGSVPVVTGVMAGPRHQFLGFSRVRDEDAGNRTEIQEMSKAGYLGTDKRYGWRTLAIDLTYIGATEYDNTIRNLRRLTFELDAPFVGVMDYGAKPERAWLYRYDGTQFSAPMNRTYRGFQLRGREVGPLLR